MADQTATDRDIIEAIGFDALLAHGYSEFAVKKWMQKKRGIPWKERARVKRIASERRVRLPADFLEQQRAA